jgi:hypothetical protein
MISSNRLQNPYVVTLAVGIVYLGLLIWLWGHFNGDPLGFVHRGTVFSEGDPSGTRGYDGQFYYYTATDPWNAATYMDNPTFRLQRVFYPVVIIVVSLGQASLVPYAMIVVNYLAVLGGTLLVGLLLARWGRSPWFTLGYSLAGGIPVALTFDTAEPLTFALVALGIYLWDRADPWINRPPVDSDEQAEPASLARVRGKSAYWPLLIGGALAFAAALLTRELALYFVVAYVLVGFYVIGKDAIIEMVRGGMSALVDGLKRGFSKVGPAPLLALLAFLPVLLWSAYLSITSHYLGVAFVQPFEYIPFLAYLLQLEHPNLRSVGYASQYIVPTAVFGVLAVWRTVATWRWPSPLAIAVLGNVHLMMFLPRLGYQHQVAASRYMLGLALAAVLWAGASRPRWLLWLTPLFILGLLVYLYGFVRQDPAYLW